ncbi:hypothetical protein GY45DRAFT_845779 [Cubamyces sp. BRFM 1775]|nr:hypothetical protein GY45DRAFT_845779 [Cubamyces sp. BRFM 1775]
MSSPSPPRPDVTLEKTILISLTMPQSHPSLPPRPEFIPFTVINFCSASPWDGLDYMTFPERRGWLVHHKDEQCHVLCPPGFCHDDCRTDKPRGPTSPMLSRVDVDGWPVTSTSKAAFLQAWLFFGTLHEVSRLCGLSIDVDAEFLIDGGRAISTAALNGLAGRWFASLDRKDVGDRAFMQRIFVIFRHIALLLNEEGVDDGVPEWTPVFTYTPEEARVFFLIEVLLHTIGLHLLLHCYSPGFSCDEGDGWDKRMIQRTVEWKDRRVEGLQTLGAYADVQLEARGWCPSELERLTLGEGERFFASLLDRPCIRDHSNCGHTVCSAYQTDEATYATVHVDATCNCDLVCVSTKDLTQALGQDKIPAVLISEDLELEIVDAASYPYIALSHVWADGLGNPVRNALPKCQLRRLRGYVVELYNTHYRHLQSTSGPAVAFWMDTLCVPVAEEAKAFRKKAIQLLGKTYDEATAVLVLDRELETVDAASAPFLEIALRILCSGWVKRLWTLQEATLASEAHGEEKIYFQMGDGPLLYQKYDRDRPARYAMPNNTDPREIAAEERVLLYEDCAMILLGDFLPSVRAMRTMRERWTPFQVMYSAIKHRATSKVEDVPLCIASLFGLEVSTIVHAPDGEHRLKAFYILMRMIPRAVLWVEDVQKLSIAPFRWAPVSITACPLSTFMGGWGEDTCDEQGLHIRPYSSFMLTRIESSEALDALPDHFRLVDAETDEYYGGTSWLSGERRAVPLPGPHQKLGLIIKPPEALVKTPNAAFVLATAESTGGDDDDEVTGTIIAYRDFEADEEGPEDTVIYCIPMSESQRWCIT